MPASVDMPSHRLASANNFWACQRKTAPGLASANNSCAHLRRPSASPNRAGSHPSPQAQACARQHIHMPAHVSLQKWVQANAPAATPLSSDIPCVFGAGRPGYTSCQVGSGTSPRPRARAAPCPCPTSTSPPFRPGPSGQCSGEWHAHKQTYSPCVCAQARTG